MKHLRNTALALLVSAVLVTSASSCAVGRAQEERSSGPGVAGKRIAYLTLTQSCEYCARQAEAFTRAMEAAGAHVTTSVTDWDAAEQAQQLNQAASREPDVIVVWPTDNTSIIPALDRLRRTSDIPVVVTTYLPRTEDTSLWTTWVGPNDYQLGVQAAESLISGLQASGLGETGSVIEVTGTPGGGSTIDRGRGFQDTLAERAPGLRIVGSQPGDWDQTTATTAAANLFSQFGHDHVVGVFAQADNMVAGTLVAARRAGFTPGKDLIAVGSDCTIEGYTNIQAGRQFGTSLQDPAADGREIAEITQSVLRGEDVEKVNYIDTPAITAANLADCASAVGK